MKMFNYDHRKRKPKLQKNSIALMVKSDMAIEDDDFSALSKFAGKPRKDQIIEPFKSPVLKLLYKP
jgi:hypothetical protein